MKITIFENEKSMVEGAFDAMNLAYFNNSVNFQYFSTSQDALPYNLLADSDIIFVDIQLTAKSELDGFNLIKALIPVIGKEKLAIITGYSKNAEILKELGLPEIPIITKPVDYIRLHEFVKEHFGKLILKR